jgi:hypothetical protein
VAAKLIGGKVMVISPAAPVPEVMAVTAAFAPPVSDAIAMNLKFAVGIAEFLSKPYRTWAREGIRFVFLFT